MRNCICLVVAFAAAISASAEEKVLITQFDLSDNATECGEVRVGAKYDGSVMCVDDKGIYGGHLQNLGMHANSHLTVDLGEGALRLEVDCAVDDRGLDGNAQFQVLLDGKVAADSGIVRRKQGKKHFTVDLRGAKKLTFKVLDGGDGINGDHGDWFNLCFYYEDGKFPPGDVRTVSPRQLGILTPKPGPAPRINGPVVYGVRPGHPVIYRLPVTGERPMELAAKNLPEGLTVVVRPLSDDAIGELAEGERPLLALDISLVDNEGNEYEPKDDPNVGAVSVQIKHPSLGNLGEDESLALYHIVDDIAQTVGSASQTADDTLDFATGSFSPFIIVAAGKPGATATGSDGETHNRKITITNMTGDIYVKGTGTKLQFLIEGGAIPERISVVDPEYVASGTSSKVYEAGLMDYEDDYADLDSGGFDYAITANPDGSGAIDPTTTPSADPVYVTFSLASLANAPTGRWAFLFWFKDTPKDGDPSRVYMVKYVTIVPTPEIKAILRDDGYGLTQDGFGGYYFNKCSLLQYATLPILLQGRKFI